MALLGQARLTAGWRLWVPGATSGWRSTEHLEPLVEQSRKYLLVFQAAGCALPCAAQAEVNPATMREGGPVYGEGRSINLYSHCNPMPGRQEHSVNGVGGPEWNEFSSSSALLFTCSDTLGKSFLLSGAHFSHE